VLFIRHGETRRPADVYIHELDVHLTRKGKLQSKSLKALLKQFQPEAIAVSTLPRCVETLNLAISPGKPPVLRDLRLRERAFTPLFGLSFREIACKYGRETEERLRNCGEKLSIQGVESIEEAQERVLKAVLELGSRYRRVAVVSHGGPHSWLCCYAFGISLSALRCFHLGFCRYSLFRVKKDKLGLITLNGGTSDTIDFERASY
jgi:broad specificity phosphatase PhoE